jgi:hypothetical protein
MGDDVSFAPKWILLCSTVTLASALPAPARGDPSLVLAVRLPGVATRVVSIGPPGTARLFALVADEAPRSKGFVVLDARDPRAPEQVGHLPLADAEDLAVSQDGSYALASVGTVRPRCGRGEPCDDTALERVNEIVRIDLSDLRAPREAWRTRSVGGVALAISPDARSVAAVRKDAEGREELVLFRAGATGLTTLAAERWHASGTSMRFSADGRLLFVLGYLFFQAYRVDAGTLAPVSAERSTGLGRSYCIAGASNDGRAFLVREGLFGGIDELAAEGLVPRLARLRGEYACLPQGARTDGTLLVSEGPGPVFVAIDVGERAAPRIAGRWLLPGPPLALGPRDILYVGLSSGLGVVDLSRWSLDAAALERAHSQAMRVYAERNEPRLLRTSQAVRILESAGARVAISAPLPGLPPAVAARILNDYGFLLSRETFGWTAISALRRAIELDPSRAVAHLNLAEAMRRRLRWADTFEDKVSLSREIVQRYRRYLALGGKTRAGLEAFMADNMAVRPPADACQAIVRYANAGRLEELFGSGDRVHGAGGRLLNLEVLYQGAARVPSVEAYDSGTDEWVAFDAPFEHLWGGDALAVVPLPDGHHLLWYRDERHLVELHGMGAAEPRRCAFKTTTRQSVSPRSAEPALCRSLLTRRRPRLIPFEGKALIDYEAIRSAGFWETSAEGTARLDVDGDGEKELLVRMSLSSGGGAGCEAEFFELLEPGGRAIARGETRELLRRMQGMGDHPVHPRFRVPHCQNRAGWFVHGQKVYFENRFAGEQPIDSMAQFHEVVTVRRGAVHKACDFTFDSRVSLAAPADLDSESEERDAHPASP